MHTLLIEREPVSVNIKAKHLDYEAELLASMMMRYPLLSGRETFYGENDRLYVQLLYISKKKRRLDVDNIMKYTIDSFRKYLYKDDRQIEYALSQSITCKDNELTGISVGQFEESIAERIFEFLLSEDEARNSCTYFECGLMTDKFYHPNLEELWK